MLSFQIQRWHLLFGSPSKEHLQESPSLIISSYMCMNETENKSNKFLCATMLTLNSWRTHICGRYFPMRGCSTVETVLKISEIWLLTIENSCSLHIYKMSDDWIESLNRLACGCGTPYYVRVLVGPWHTILKR